MNSTVSVVITTHNRIELLPRAIESAKRQTHTPLEIIVVDDCSSDGTVETYINDSSITFIQLPFPSGANVARNCGIDAAQGGFVAFLDDDDYWEPTKLETQLEALFNETAHFSYTAIRTVTPQEVTIKERFHSPKYPDDIFKSLMVDNFIGSTSSIMVERSFCNDHEIRFDSNLRSMQDYDFCLQFFQHTNAIAAVNLPLTSYHQENGSQWKKISGNYEAFADAQSYLLTKYRKNESVSFLRKSLQIIFIKKCIKMPLFFFSFVKSKFKQSEQL